MYSDSHPLTQQLAPADPAITIGQDSRRGKHDINQDCYAARLPDSGLLDSKGVALAIADGISTSAFSHIASEIAVTGVLEDYASTPQTWSVKKSAQCIINAINAWLFAHSRRSGLTGTRRDQGYACTLSLLILKSTTAHILHIGDARIYRIRHGQIEQLTRDHHAYDEYNHPRLSRALGIEAHVEVDYLNLPIQKNDIYLLLTDGVHSQLNEAALLQASLEHQTAQSLARYLVSQAQIAGTQDDCTAQVLYIHDLALPHTDELLTQPVMLPCPPLLEDGDEMDHYKIIHALHASSRSHIYLAQHIPSGERVVIKIPSLDARHDLVYLERLLMEEWLIQHIHSNHVVSPAKHTQQKTALYAVYAFIEGITLTTWINNNPCPSLAQVRSIIEQVARGLQALHRLDIMHRDLRPDNIMIDQSGIAYIIDLGSANAPGIEEWQSEHTEPANGLGTFAYSAPEILLGERASIQSDQYALAAITYYMLSGQLPYGTAMARARSRKEQTRLLYTPVSSPERDLPVWIDETLSRALHPTPEQRFEELSEFIQGLRVAPRYRYRNHTHSLISRNPLRFWQSLSTFLVMTIIVLLWLLSRQH